MSNWTVVHSSCLVWIEFFARSGTIICKTHHGWIEDEICYTCYNIYDIWVFSVYESYGGILTFLIAKKYFSSLVQQTLTDIDVHPTLLSNFFWVTMEWLSSLYNITINIIEQMHTRKNTSHQPFAWQWASFGYWSGWNLGLGNVKICYRTPWLEQPSSQ